MVLIRDQRTVYINRNLPSKCLIQTVVFRCRGKIFISADNVRDSHQMVIDHVRKIVSRESIGFDQKFYRQDIRGSIAHVKMLAKQGILTEKERDQILEGLEGILEDVKSGKLEITSEYEDIHSFVEANLIARKGEVGKKTAYRKKPQ